MEHKPQLDRLFQQAANEGPHFTYAEMEGQFRTQLRAGKPGLSRLFTLKNGIIMLSIISFLAVLYALFIPTEQLALEEQDAVESHPVQRQHAKPTAEAPTEMRVEAIAVNDQQINRVVSVFPLDDSEEPETSTALLDDLDSADLVVSKPLAEQVEVYTPVGDTAYKLPVLTAEERKANEKRKAQLLKQLLKTDRKQYAFIPMGTFTHAGKSVSVQAFFMQTTEVTNLEYRVFLLDLLIQGKPNEFLKYRPDQEKWCNIDGTKNTYNEPLRKLYFSHPAYDEYPVNNISREGAEAYCKWLSEEAQKSGIKAKGDLQPVVRIPTNYEWMYAAYGGHTEQRSYPWNSDEIRNEKGNYLANHKPEQPESSSDEAVSAGTTTFALDGAMHTAQTGSYAPNDFGLYNMSGNVAEMVSYHSENNQPGTCGGGWLNGPALLKIAGEDLYKGKTEPHANIGFRVVFTYMQ